MSIARGRLGAALFAVPLVGAVAVGVGIAIANHAGQRSGPIAGIPVQRVVLHDANGAPIGVQSTATLRGRSQPAGRSRGAVPAAALPGTTGLARAYAFRGNGPLRIGALDVPTGARLYWTMSGPAGAGFAIRGAAHRGSGVVVSSRASRGSTRVAAGSYDDIAVRTAGRWTVVVVPRH